jgi:tetratricopeptide (TPR) repeat protein
VLGLIEHHPRSALATRSELTGASFAKGAALYRALVAAHPNDAAIVGNAGCYLLAGVLEVEGTLLEAVRLLERAERLDRSEPRWPWMLGFAASVDAEDADTSESRGAAARGLDRLQRALDLAQPSPPEWMRPQLLSAAERMTELAWLAADLPKAREQARRTLDLARSWSVDWQRANAIHAAETILGYAALAEERVDQASSHLLASARVSGSPQLGSFGPDLGLALELIERGRVDAAVSYLDLCAHFWNPGVGVLEDWKRSIRAGRRVDFTGHFYIARRRALGAAAHR